MKNSIVFAAMMAYACAIHADAPSQTYAQYLVAHELSAHPRLLGLTMHVSRRVGEPNIVIASNVASLGKAAGADDLQVIASGKTLMQVSNGGDRLSVELPLLDASRRIVGALGVQLPYVSGADKAELAAVATGIRDELARRISHVANLLEPVSYDARVSPNNYGQELVDEALAARPEILILALHANLPKTNDNVIVASNIGRFGKKGDEDDLRLIRSEKPNLEINADGNRFEAELVLRDVSGTNIGAVGVVYAYRAGDDKLRLQRQAEAVQASLSRHITNAGNLFERVPYAPDPPLAPYAQDLVERTLTRHPELLILAIHVRPPGGSDPVIIASNIGRIGKKADEDDLGVIDSGKPLLEVNEAGNRFEVEVVLQDSSGRTIGAVSPVFAYKPGADREQLHRQGEQIRDELRRLIPNLAALFGPKANHP